MIEEQEDTPVAEAPEEAPEATEEVQEEAAAAAPAEPAEPEEQLSPKERRKRARQRGGQPRPQRTPDERRAEREAERARLASHRRTRRQREREARRAEGPRQGTPPAEREPGRQRVRQGIVVSDKADKTITVKIEIARPHRIYKKIVRTSQTLHAHDERNEAHVGDTVRVIESRPLSRTKRWRLVEILERAR